MVVDEKKPVVPPHANSNVPSAPPQTIKNHQDIDSGVSSGDSFSNNVVKKTSADLNWTFPEPPSTFAGGPPGNNGGSGGNGGDLDFDELARRFDQLKKK
ncbi:unnamed protein product [Strongylus vulgaris]|uniref:Uncharacterized protein n=1 Tax=Strongylus vulgaris TaxID=40348 RepID=A0A3P7JC80_STRVU|nr:unnamed protein product [Strongylus vulgaris]